MGNLKNSGGRAGCGEVMGSKNLKAIVARGHGGIQVARYQDFLDAYSQFSKKVDLGLSRDRWVPVWSTYGAAVLARIFQGMGNQMTNNAQEMSMAEQKTINIGAENYLNNYVTKAKVCDCCPMALPVRNYTKFLLENLRVIKVVIMKVDKPLLWALLLEMMI